MQPEDARDQQPAGDGYAGAEIARAKAAGDQRDGENASENGVLVRPDSMGDMPYPTCNKRETP